MSIKCTVEYCKHQIKGECQLESITIKQSFFYHICDSYKHDKSKEKRCLYCGNKKWDDSKDEFICNLYSGVVNSFTKGHECWISEQW